MDFASKNIGIIERQSKEQSAGIIQANSSKNALLVTMAMLKMKNSKSSPSQIFVHVPTKTEI